jgi:sec-independent protein translocase protein TatC
VDPTLTSDEFASDVDQQVDERSRMSFLEHLDELRRRILFSLYAIIACMIVAFFYWDTLFDYYVWYFGVNGGTLIYTKPMSGFMFSLKLSALAALLVAAPFIFSQIWLFVAPGLYAKEKKVLLPFVFCSSLLFLGGAWFAHKIAYPSMWKFFASYERAAGPPTAAGALGHGLTFFPDLDTTFSFYVKVILGLGLVFQMPVLVFFLARFGVLTAGFMLRKFKYAVLIIFVVAAIITPSGDPVNLAVFAAPMLVLYLFSIGVAWLFGKKREPETA